MIEQNYYVAFGDFEWIKADKQDRLICLSAVIVDPYTEKIKDRLHLNCSDTAIYMDKIMERFTGITTNDLEKGISEEQCIKQLKQFLANYDITILKAWGIDYDLIGLRQSAERTGEVFNSLEDVSILYTKTLRNFKYLFLPTPSIGLKEFCTIMLKQKSDKVHNSLYDSERLALSYLKLQQLELKPENKFRHYKYYDIHKYASKKRKLLIKWGETAFANDITKKYWTKQVNKLNIYDLNICIDNKFSNDDLKIYIITLLLERLTMLPYGSRQIGIVIKESNKTKKTLLKLLK